MHRLMLGIASVFLLIFALACGAPPDTDSSSPAPPPAAAAPSEQDASEADPSEAERSAEDAAAAADLARDQFWAHLAALCGQAFGGDVITDTEEDPRFIGWAIYIHVRRCSEQRIEIPFHIGEDRSRTWVLTRPEGGLKLEHDHRHEDGSPDTITLYGGTAEPGTATRQSFPTDDYTQELFELNELIQSMYNVWTMEIVPGERFTYELKRPGRYFRADFDLENPVPDPEGAWY